MKNQRNRHFLAICGTFALFMVTCTFSGCGALKTAENALFRESVLRDTVYISRAMVDSAYIRDSVHVREAGDTVEVYVERWRVRDRWRTDTVYRSVTDTLLQTETRTIKVTAPESRWKRMQRCGFWALLLVLAAVGAVKLRRLLP